KQSTDIQIPGRNLDLHVTRTYTSTDTVGGSLGPGWTWNYVAELHEDHTCNCVNVRTPDGSSQLFHTTDWQTFTPEKGYHTKLTALARQVSGTTNYVLEYEFTDKSGTRFHFSTWSVPPPDADPVKCPPLYKLD